MARPRRGLTLTPDDRRPLLRWAGDPKNGPAADRATMVLMAAEGTRSTVIAKEVGYAPSVVCKWLDRYRRYGLRALIEPIDKSRLGRPLTVDDAAVARIRELVQERAWSTRVLAREMKLPRSTLMLALKRHGIRLKQS